VQCICLWWLCVLRTVGGAATATSDQIKHEPLLVVSRPGQRQLQLPVRSQQAGGAWVRAAQATNRKQKPRCGAAKSRSRSQHNRPRLVQAHEPASVRIPLEEVGCCKPAVAGLHGLNTRHHGH